MTMATWHVLTTGDGRYWGTVHEQGGSPMAALVGLQAAMLVRSKQLIACEQRRAWDLLRVRVRPVPVLVTGAGPKESRIVEEKTLCRAAH